MTGRTGPQAALEGLTVASPQYDSKITGQLWRDGVTAPDHHQMPR